MVGDRGLLMGSDLARTCEEIGRYSTRDAARYPDYEQLLDRTARALEPMLDAPPPDPSRLRPSNVLPMLRVAGRVLRIGKDLPRALSLLLGEVPREQFRVFSGARPLGEFDAHTANVHADPSTNDLAELIDDRSARTRARYLFGGLASGRSRIMAAKAGSKSPTARTSTRISTMSAAEAAIFVSSRAATLEALSGLAR